MRPTFAPVLAILCLCPTHLQAQTPLSSNSGINTSDTWVTLDMMISDSATVSFSQAVYNPQTRSYTSSLAINPTPRSFHVEAGYDSTGSLVMNLWPEGTIGSLYSTDTSNLGYIRFAGGQVEAIDQAGNVMQNVLPDSRIGSSFPLSMLGSNPGPSVIASLVVPNIQQYASALNAQLTTSGQTAFVRSSFSQTATANWTYTQSGNYWLAQQVTINVSASQTSDTRTIQFSNLNWNDNASNDQARAAAGTTVQSPPSAGPFPSTFSWTAPASPALSQSGPTISPTDCNSHTYNFGGSQNIVFQHGFRSSSCTWTRMANWLNQDFPLGKEVIPSLDATSGISTQGQALISQMQSAGGANYIVMGHSMGGLVSRYAAQYFSANNPSALFGVASIDAPHQGADSAYNLPVIGGVLFEGNATQMWIDNGCVSPWDSVGCFIAWVTYWGGSAAQGYYANTAALQDMTPGSQALQSLNATPENFTRAGVIGYTPQRWLFTRVALNWVLGIPGVCRPTDPACCPPESGCGERNFATATEIFYDVDVAAAAFTLFEIETYCEYNSGDQNCQVPQSLINLFTILVRIAVDLDITDFTFDALVDFPGDGSSDGLVQGPSQYYPGQGAVQYALYNADSHSGALKSPLDHPVLDTLLANTFRIQPSTSCTFSVPTSLSSPDTFGGSGGSDSFNVSTSPAGCSWSAVSQTPWITLTAGVNGAGNGTVSFSVAADNATSSRVGTIQVGNGSNYAQFYVSQNGSCSYSLSQGPVIAIPASGGSATVQVYTQQNCIWSASSNAAWLTLSNSSGTGGGSFTWTAAANPGSVGRTGTITVANQSLTIVDGNPVGTPGTATVTINGSPQSFTFSACPPQYGGCYQTIWESGSVSITVDGITFTQYYGGGTGGDQIASGLAAQMNYQYSPVTAIANGSTITISAAVNGADTNFPLTGSETYDPQCGNYGYNGTYYCFPGPAFTVQTPPQLSGGTD